MNNRFFHVTEEVRINGKLYRPGKSYRITTENYDGANDLMEHFHATFTANEVDFNAIDSALKHAQCSFPDTSSTSTGVEVSDGETL